jgi:hypothetical protein
MKLLYFFVFFIPYLAFSQQELNNVERAYLFHVVKKSPILNTEIGRYFDYTGPKIVLKDGTENFDSIELLIMEQPELLVIRTTEISKSAKGILSETANKMALWELNKVLLAARGNERDLDNYREKYERFINVLIDSLPDCAFKLEDSIKTIQTKVFNALNPSLSLNDKIANIEAMRNCASNERIQILNAISFAVEKYTENRSFEIYKSLGGEATTYINRLIAAGDGSNTSGLLEEREKDEKGDWNKGLPKAIGFFPYQLQLVDTDGQLNIQPKQAAVLNMSTVGGKRETNLHFDVWGYNSEKQTTVIIKKNGIIYPLFGSAETRFLSPDTTFGKGGTLQEIINDLKFNKVGYMQEMIYGKDGFNANLEELAKIKVALEVEMNKNEAAYNEMHTKPIYTLKRSTREMRKERKKLKKDPTYMVENDNQPITISGKSKKGKKQNTLINLYKEYNALKATIADFERQKTEATDILTSYLNKLRYFEDLFGTKWAKFTVTDGLYTFEDSTTFDLYTQEFTFPASARQEEFEIKLIAIPENSLSSASDEVMLHVNLVDAIPNYDARLQVDLEDVFLSDSWKLEHSLLKPADSVAVLQFFEQLLNKKKAFNIVARGQGVGIWDSCRVIKDLHPIELNSYPISRMDSTYSRLRKSEVFIEMDRDIQMEINSYTDPVKSNITISNSSILDLMERYQLSKNDILSAYRTATIIQKLKTELTMLAGTYLSRENAKIVIDRFNNTLSKLKISVGATSIKWSEIVL